jgi:small-conductance mechanosensitive channel
MASEYAFVEKRINRLTLIIGAMGAATAWIVFSPRAASGVLVGSVLAWLNARWMEEALDTLTLRSRSQSGAPAPRVPVWTWVKFFSRYGLMAVVIYVMFDYFDVPVVSVLCGLLALGAAAMAELAIERLAPSK